MYETVKTVNGHEIYRMKGTKGFYHVKTWESADGKSRRVANFKTIKAAVAFCETL